MNPRHTTKAASSTIPTAPRPTPQRRRGWSTKAERARITTDATRQYAAGASIRQIAAAVGRSYGFTHRLLTSAGVPMRTRGAASSRRRPIDANTKNPT